MMSQVAHGFFKNNSYRTKIFQKKMSSLILNKSKPIFQILGANTDVGKTIISSGICLAHLKRGGNTSYIKPIQTGPTSDADFVSMQVSNLSKTLNEVDSTRLETSTLFGFGAPVSPHLAAIQDQNFVSDTEVIRRLEEEVERVLLGNASLVMVEGAGGVLSPGPSGLPQADLFRALHLPVLLIGDGRLGGISATLAAYEALVVRGYDIPALLTLQDPGDEDLGHTSYFEDKLKGTGCKVIGLDSLPPEPEPLTEWFHSAMPKLQDALDHMAAHHQKRFVDWQRAREDTAKSVWWPFTQHQGVKSEDVIVIDSAFSDDLHVASPSENEKEVQMSKLFDGCASWWTQGVGHGNSELALAAAHAAGRYGHVIFPGAIHAPALELTKEILKGPGKGWASRVFFSDNGSTAVEVGLKMAFRKYLKTHGLKWDDPPMLAAIAQMDSYHGDTLGCMDLSVPSVFNQGQQPWYQPRNLSLHLPTLGWKEGIYTVSLPKCIKESINESTETIDQEFSGEAEAFDIDTRLKENNEHGTLREMYQTYITKAIDDYHEENSDVRLGALVMEPVLLGAGGMLLVDPLFQRVLVQECRDRGIPVVYDEVFSGLWRLGFESCGEILGINPDVSCYAKLLTGGLIPLAVTVASPDIFEAFEGDTKAEALLHGHSYTAHPVGCAVAVKSLSMYSKSENYDHSKHRMKDFWAEDDVVKLSHLPNVRHSHRIGTVLAVELESKDSGYASNATVDIVKDLRYSGIYLRPLGNVLYIMASPFTSTQVCKQLCLQLYDRLSKN